MPDLAGLCHEAKGSSLVEYALYFTGNDTEHTGKRWEKMAILKDAEQAFRGDDLPPGPRSWGILPERRGELRNL